VALVATLLWRHVRTRRPPLVPAVA
jgi:hypothetical protein